MKNIKNIVLIDTEVIWKFFLFYSLKILILHSVSTKKKYCSRLLKNEKLLNSLTKKKIDMVKRILEY